MSSYVLPVLLSGSVPSSSGDFFAPVITNVSSGTPTSSGATITWTTDENSNSQVVYGATSAYGSSTTLHAVSVTSHSEAITGLSSNTLYHYAVKSADASGNLATSDDHTFTTAGGGPNLLSGIIHYWNFDEASGNWADSVGSNTIVEAGAPTHISGLIGRGLETGNSTGVGYATGMDLSGSVTIAGWVRPYGLDGLANYFVPFASQGDAGTSSLDFYMHWDSVLGAWDVQTGADRGTDVTVTQAIDYVSGTSWYFICWRYDLATTTARLRANTDNATPNTSHPGFVHISGSQPTAIGQIIGNGAGYNLRGTIDELGIWNRSLSDAEVDLLYNSGAGITYPFT